VLAKLAGMSVVGVSSCNIVSLESQILKACMNCDVGFSSSYLISLYLTIMP
jgi:hypothetical protein